MFQPDITIVVCTFNRAAMLAEALASLYDLVTKGQFTYEILVVDNASTDATPQTIARAARESQAPLRGVREAERGIVPARNRGIREARGRRIAFFDDDQLADSCWLSELRRGAAEHGAPVVGGAVVLSLPPGCERQLAMTVRMLLGEAAPSPAPRRYGGRLTPGCGNLMIERSVFDKVGVFQRTVDGRGEDTDLFYRIRQSRIEAWYLPSAIIHHQTPAERLTEPYLLDIAARMGRGIGQRQARQMGRVRFPLFWMAKLLWAALAQAPRWYWNRCQGRHEAALGHRCQLAITAGFLRGGREVWEAARHPATKSPEKSPTLSPQTLKGLDSHA